MTPSNCCDRHLKVHGQDPDEKFHLYRQTFVLGIQVQIQMSKCQPNVGMRRNIYIYFLRFSFYCYLKRKKYIIKKEEAVSHIIYKVERYVLTSIGSTSVNISDWLADLSVGFSVYVDYYSNICSLSVNIHRKATRVFEHIHDCAHSVLNVIHTTKNAGYF